ncbi:MAG: DegT/DnrJ/EryC1/StrS family aminotransferase [Phycisphaeraceae bacterium]|nr:DegT/DnrJ/EryC1/StrS family aminotransferase [Phycisphaeraceae bacterium]
MTLTSTQSPLAILGGTPTVPDTAVKHWPPIDDTDRKMVLDSLNGGKHAFGPNSQAFQEEMAAWNGNKYGIFTNSGTAALHMGLVGCGVGAGDHVLVTGYSWSSSATCIIHHNAIPIFVDIDFDTINMDIDKIEAAITSKTKAIVAVHLHGLALNMDKLMAIANKYNLKVIEDACQSHGALYKGRKVGTMGHCAALSFNQNKSLCAGESGMFLTDDEEICAGAASLWSFGETRTPLESRDYHAYALGWMYRGNDLTAAFGRSQLRKLDGYLEAERSNAAVLRAELQDITGLILPTEPEGHSHTYYNFSIRIDMQAIGWTGDPVRMRDAIVKAVQAEGSWCCVWQRFILPSMTVFQAKNAYGKGSPWAEHDALDIDYNPANFPVAQRHSDTHFAVIMPLRAPNGPDVAKLTGQGIRKVFENISKIDPDQILDSK